MGVEGGWMGGREWDGSERSGRRLTPVGGRTTG